MKGNKLEGTGGRVLFKQSLLSGEKGCNFSIVAIYLVTRGATQMPENESSNRKTII